MAGGVTLFAGTQGNFFPTNAPAACLTAFNTTLSCDTTVQLLNTQTEWVGWNQTNLTSLCTSTCYNSLVSLRTSVTQACGTYAVPFNGDSINASQIMDFYQYKYNLTCLADAGTFCLIKEATWNIPQMVASGKATWPKNTNKTYLDWDNDPISGSPVVDQGTTYPPWTSPPPAPTWTSSASAALDYFYTGGPIMSANLGWNSTLEYDEYPTEIQCSPCWLNRFQLNFASQWGETYDELTAQIWQNMQKNCQFTKTLYVYPDLNISGPPVTTQIITWNSLPSCDQQLVVNDPSGRVDTNSFAFSRNVTSAGLYYKNGNVTSRMENGTYCAPLSCAVMNVTSDTDMNSLQQSTPALANLSIVQLNAWNPNARLQALEAGEVICIGPPGGAYIPAPTTVVPAYPTVYTTTAKATEPTPSGTIPNCGLYYGVKSGDYCNLIALNFSISFSDLIDMNPSIDSACSNLLANYDYCVAPVNGTSVKHQTTTAAPVSKTTTTTATNTKSSTTVPPPAPTTSGTTSTCYKWYVVQSGDSCYAIEQAQGITFAQFQKWNTQVNTDCTNIYPGDAYCVSGP